MTDAKAPDHKKVKEAIRTVIAHLEAEWGFCDEDDYAMGCAACEAVLVRKRLESIENFLNE